MNKVLIIFAATLMVATYAGQAAADPIADLTCGPDPTDERHASMDWAEDCWQGLNNPKDDPELQSYMPGDPWMDVGRLEDSPSGGFLSWSFISGSWGGGDFSGTWTITDGFWDIYEEAIITIHVGNGNGDPDHFAFLITPGDYSGVLSYWLCGSDCKGGGLSNIVLWARDVPEPGTMGLLGIGLLMVAMTRRRKLKI